MKKLLLIIALLISALVLNAQYATIGDLEFTVTSEAPAECAVSGYSGELTDVTIPSTVTISGKEYTVTSIGDVAFSGCFSLTSIELPSGVTSIGEWAFYGCSSLTSIEITSSVTSIGDGTFCECSSLTSIEIPSGVTSIGYQAFYGCSSLTSIELPSSVTSIGGYAFSGCSSLTSIELPSGVTSIGDFAFAECSSLISIEIPSGVTSIGTNLFAFCPSLTSIVVESGNTVYDSRNDCNAIIETATHTLIAGCQNTVIPNTVTSIGDNAFANCSSLTSIEIPSGVTSIGYEAFYGCSSLTSIELPSSVTSIGGYAFYVCSSLTSIEIPSGVTSIGEEAFAECDSLTSIELPSSVTSIGTNPFAFCPSLTSIVVESGNTVYDSRNDCNAIIETATHTLIAGCQNTVIPNTVTSIGNYAFSACSSLTSIEIPSGVTSIGYQAFYGCSSLTSIEIPSGVTSIGEEAFVFCSSLTSIYCYAEIVPETGSYAFAVCPSDMVIYVPAISVNAYKATSPWNNHTIMPLACVVTASSNPEEAGVITGTGEYTFNDTVTLKATANEGYKFLNWTENGEVVSNEAKYLFIATKDRDLVANFELTDGIDELSSAFNLYPNPVNDKLYIETLTQTLIVEIYDVYGRRQVIETPSHQGNLIIDVTNLDSGVYFVKVVTENGEAVKRILKF